MKFTVVSHACLYVESGGTRLLVDPWLIGSCYWRSWWNFPEPKPELLSSLKPTHIYITHLHWDHFHGPSLQLFPKDITILVPKIQSHRMVLDLHDLGFKNIVEMPHGKHFDLSPSLEIRSYQFGICADSALAITDGFTTLLDANDTKVFGLPLKQILRDYPKLDFVFRSHSNASGLPFCIEGHQNQVSWVRNPDDYAEEFTEFALTTGCKYAIPFASNHCFLHRETLDFNKTSMGPAEVKGMFISKVGQKPGAPKCIVMPPGSFWKDSDGFAIPEFDYKNKENYVQSLASKHQEKLAASYEEDSKSVPDFNSFSRYFEKFVGSLPRILTRVWKPTIAFKVEDRGVISFWSIDLATRKISSRGFSKQASVTIETPNRVLNDCTRKKMFSVWTASKRLRVQLKDMEKGYRDVRLFFSLLDLYELDILPLRKNLSMRSLSVCLRRWREAVEFAKVLFQTRVQKKPFQLIEAYRQSTHREAA